MAQPKEMLSALIQCKQLTRREQEAFEGMWDAIHRYGTGSLSHKQKAWIEKTYFDRKLDQSDSKSQDPKRPKSGTFTAVRPQQKSPRIGYINHSGTRETLLITSVAKLTELCPDIQPGSSQYLKVEEFFRKGGQVLKIKPAVSAAGPRKTA